MSWRRRTRLFLAYPVGLIYSRYVDSRYNTFSVTPLFSSPDSISYHTGGEYRIRAYEILIKFRGFYVLIDTLYDFLFGFGL